MIRRTVTNEPIVEVLHIPRGEFREGEWVSKADFFALWEELMAAEAEWEALKGSFSVIADGYERLANALPTYQDIGNRWAARLEDPVNPEFLPTSDKAPPAAVPDDSRPRWSNGGVRRDGSE